MSNREQLLIQGAERILLAVDNGEVHCDVLNGRFWSGLSDLRAALNQYQQPESIPWTPEEILRREA